MQQLQNYKNVDLAGFVEDLSEKLANIDIQQDVSTLLENYQSLNCQ